MGCDAPWQPGVCQETWHFARGDCSTDTVGMWVISSADECIRRCRACDGCGWISYSQRERDCSWYTDCTRARRTPTDHCTLAVKPAAQGLMSYCPHGGFVNQLYEMLTAASLASEANLILQLRPILVHQTWWVSEGSGSACDATKVADFMEVCHSPGWAKNSSVRWPSIIDEKALPSRVVSDAAAILTHSRVDLGHIGSVCNSRFTRSNLNSTVHASCGATALASLEGTIGKAVPSGCLRQVVERSSSQLVALGSTFDLLEGLLTDGTFLARHVRFSTSVLLMATEAVARLRARGGGSFWCAHVRVGAGKKWDTSGGFFPGLFQRDVRPALSHWARNLNSTSLRSSSSVGWLATDNLERLRKAVPELCEGRQCTLDSELEKGCDASWLPEQCRTVALAATCLVCAHATRLFLTGGSTFSRLILDLHAGSDLVHRDAAFHSESRSVAISGYFHQMPFGGAQTMVTRLREQGTELSFTAYRRGTKRANT